MKFSYNWLRELVPTLSLPPRELMRLITMKTAECEGVEEFGPWLAEVCVARVLEVAPIEGSHNVKAVVDAGPVRQQDRGLRRAQLPRRHTHRLRPGRGDRGRQGSEARTITGVESDGMLATGAELGINRDHEGIVELPAGEPATRCRAACRMRSSRSTTRPSRTAPTCGATSAWRAKWPPSPASRWRTRST